ncbi:MAG TPA: SDR family oxidoreductase, partial [Anaeromyxobacteraceae bacterium]|nr:SDR family oxidoreductase [Anaeromyxobacteraceae bacterium]
MSDRDTVEDPAPEPEVTASDIARAVAVLTRVAEDRGLLAQVDAGLREALQRVAGEVARPAADQRRRLRKALLKAERGARKQRDETLRRGTGIQRARQASVFVTPLPALPPPGTDASAWRPSLPGASSALPHPGRAQGEAASSPDQGGPELSEPRKCYVCKAPYRQLHPFYDQLCPACGDENFARRTSTADLRGRVALVTGARVKIGYQAAILLLRTGCHVVALTRFPRDAAARYAREPDFASWRDRLTIHGIDLRHTPSVELLCQRLDATLPRLDFQIHNACQTVRRPPGFYAHLLEREHAPIASLPPAERELLREHEALKASLQG